MTDVERVLQMLIHDVRTPIGVAQGYVRLLREHRLATADEQARALAMTMDALGHIARLCEDAGAFIDSSRPARAALAAAVLVDRVAARGRRESWLVDTVAIDPAVRIQVAGDAQPVADAICVVLGTTAQPAGPRKPRVRIEIRGAELRFVATIDAPAPSSGAVRSAPERLDPWTGHGLSVPLACRLIDTRAAGSVWRTESGIMVIVPLEPTPA
jgi:signal transduction histidine kinase